MIYYITTSKVEKLELQIIKHIVLHGHSTKLQMHIRLLVLNGMLNLEVFSSAPFLLRTAEFPNHTHTFNKLKQTLVPTGYIEYALCQSEMTFYSSQLGISICLTYFMVMLHLLCHRNHTFRSL